MIYFVLFLLWFIFVCFTSVKDFRNCIMSEKLMYNENTDIESPYYTVFCFEDTSDHPLFIGWPFILIFMLEFFVGPLLLLYIVIRLSIATINDYVTKIITKDIK